MEEGKDFSCGEWVQGSVWPLDLEAGRALETPGSSVRVPGPWLGSRPAAGAVAVVIQSPAAGPGGPSPYGCAAIFHLATPPPAAPLLP